MQSLPQDLGVGITYFPGTEPLIESLSKLLDVVEFEPQTTWYKESIESDSFRFDEEVASFLTTLDQPKIFHGVGFPVGGSITPGQNYFDTLEAHVHKVVPVYLSEHLSFNQFTESKSGNTHLVNFLLPPIQNEAGIAVAVENIKSYKGNLSTPFAFETGTNYLKPFQGEIPDGEFVCRIAEESDSFILLDIHNLFANQLNGRQSVLDFLNQLPLDRVIEIHLAGGHYLNEYYLDGHSQISSDELFELAGKIVRRLPNLKSIIFEMLPEYYQKTVSQDAIINQLIKMKGLWKSRGKSVTSLNTIQKTSSSLSHISVNEWEDTLGRVANSKELQETNLAIQLISDPGINVIKEMIFHARASLLVNTLKMTCRLLKLNMGNNAFESFLKEYMSNNETEFFGLANGLRFAEFLKQKVDTIPYLEEILNLELASLSTLIDNETRFLDFHREPYELLNSLSEHRLPQAEYSETIYRVEVTPNNSSKKRRFQLDSIYHN